MPKKKTCYQCHINESLQCQRREVKPKCLECIKANATAMPYARWNDSGKLKTAKTKRMLRT